jgi:hypothetical protein
MLNKGVVVSSSICGDSSGLYKDRKVATDEMDYSGKTGGGGLAFHNKLMYRMLLGGEFPIWKIAMERGGPEKNKLDEMVAKVLSVLFVEPRWEWESKKTCLEEYGAAVNLEWLDCLLGHCGGCERDNFGEWRMRVEMTFGMKTETVRIESACRLSTKHGVVLVGDICS